MKPLAIAYHRNGCSGRGFYVLLFQEGNSRKVVIRPNATDDLDGVECYVLDVDKLAAGNIAFCSNSWRGDHYHREAYATIAAYEAKLC